MNDDDELCLCFHVTRRKVVQYLRTQKPAAPTQLSDCFGAGTGCGWCRPFLKRLWQADQPDEESLPNPEQYAKARAIYREKKDNG